MDPEAAQILLLAITAVAVLITAPSIRQYQLAVTLKNKGHDWRRKLLETWKADPNMVAMIEVLNDPNVKDKGRMEAEWMRLTGSSRATYFRYLQALPGDLKQKADALPKSKPSLKPQKGMKPPNAHQGRKPGP